MFDKFGAEHNFPLICPIWDSLQVFIDFLIFSVKILVLFTIEKDALLKLDIKMSGRSFIYIY